MSTKIKSNDTCIDPSKVIVNRTCTISQYTPTSETRPTALCVDVSLEYADDTRSTYRQFLDYHLIPYDVAMNIACEIVRGWNANTAQPSIKN